MIKVNTIAEGINVCGYLRTESGVGAAARRYLRALETLRIPLSLADVSDVSCNRAQDQEIARFDAEHPHPINLICGDIDLYFSIRSRLGDKFFDDRYNIGVWWWELPEQKERRWPP